MQGELASLGAVFIFAVELAIAGIWIGISFGFVVRGAGGGKIASWVVGAIAPVLGVVVGFCSGVYLGITGLTGKANGGGEKWFGGDVSNMLWLGVAIYLGAVALLCLSVFYACRPVSTKPDDVREDPRRR